MINPRGSIVVDEIILPIVDIYLSNGCVIFVGQAYGSFPAVHQSNYTIHDRDGGVVFRAVGITDLSWPEVVCGTLTVHAAASFIEKIATGNGEPFPYPRHS